MRRVVLAVAVAVLAAGLGARGASAGPTLAKVRANGVVTCGVSTGVAGFSMADAQGRYTGLDVDFCRQIAAAIFGDASKTKFVPLSAQQRFTAIQSGEIDVLTRNTTWTMERDTKLGLNFVPVNFFDGQGFMVPKNLGVASVKDLDGATICVQSGTTTEVNLADYFRVHKMAFKPLVIESLAEVENAYFSGRCDAFTTDRSALAAVRVTRAPNPDDQIILPETISKEPLAPAVRHGDDEWFDIVKWVALVALDAEELGIGSKNVDDLLKSDDVDIKRLLGVKPGIGGPLGLDDRWAYNLIKEVGNYGEVFERNVGSGSPLKLARGLNALWTDGGLMYGMPVR